MKFVCFGYVEADRFETLNKSEQNAIIDECLTYDDVLRKNGHFAGGEPLQDPQTAKTLRWKNGKVGVLDGSFAETKEVIGGILLLEAKDIDHAIKLMSKHTGVKGRAIRDSPSRRLRRNNSRK